MAHFFARVCSAHFCPRMLGPRFCQAGPAPLFILCMLVGPPTLGICWTDQSTTLEEIGSTACEAHERVEQVSRTARRTYSLLALYCMRPWTGRRPVRRPLPPPSTPPPSTAIIGTRPGRPTQQPATHHPGCARPASVWVISDRLFHACVRAQTLQGADVRCAGAGRPAVSDRPDRCAASTVPCTYSACTWVSYCTVHRG